jgi:hypothetical protein
LFLASCFQRVRDASRVLLFSVNLLWLLPPARNDITGRQDLQSISYPVVLAECPRFILECGGPPTLFKEPRLLSLPLNQTILLIAQPLCPRSLLSLPKAQNRKRSVRRQAYFPPGSFRLCLLFLRKNFPFSPRPCFHR